MGNNIEHTSRYSKDAKTQIGPLVNGTFHNPSGTPNKYVIALRKAIKTPLNENKEHNLLVNRTITNLTDGNYITESELLLMIEYKLVKIVDGHYKVTI